MKSRKTRSWPRRLLHAPLLHFVILGSLLYAFNTASREVPPAVLEVSAQDIAQLTRQWQRGTGRAPEDAELERLINQFIDDALLLRVARSLGWDRDDPVVQRRLIQNLRFLDPSPEKSDMEVLREAYTLDMEKSDIVVRRRLLERMRLMIGDHARSRAPSREALEAYYDAHRDDFLRPARIRLTHIHLSRDRRGDALHDDAVAVVEKLQRLSIDPEVDLEHALELADPFLVQPRLPLWSERRLGERLGPQFAREAFALPLGAWNGPVVSSYGEHAVWVHVRRDAFFPPLEEVEDKVTAALHREWEDEAMRDVLAELRSQVEIRIALAPPNS